MAYTPTTWVNDSQPAISAENLNNIESGISALDTLAGSTDISAIGDGTVTGAISTLNSRIDANTRGTVIDLTPYNSDSNKYTFPSDGYLAESSEQRDDGLIRVVICDSDGAIMALLYMNITGFYQTQSLFVKKGMKCYVLDRSDNTTVTYRALQ